MGDQQKPDEPDGGSRDNKNECIACGDQFTAAEPAYPLPDKCGGKFLHRDCLRDSIVSKINSKYVESEVTPWIESCAPHLAKNKTHIPSGDLIKVLDDDYLYVFASKYLSRILPRNSNWVPCQNTHNYTKYKLMNPATEKEGNPYNNRCPFGFVVDWKGQQKKTCDNPYCKQSQDVQKADLGGMQVLIDSGVMRLCPGKNGRKCEYPTMKDKGMCNSMNCPQCGTWWNWRTRKTADTKDELKQEARRDGSLWEPGDLAHSQNLQRNDPEGFKKLLEKNGGKFNPNHMRGVS